MAIDTDIQLRGDRFGPDQAAGTGAQHPNPVPEDRSGAAAYWSTQIDGGPVQAFRRAIRLHGRDPDRLTRGDDQDFLADLDEVHCRGKEATLELARLAELGSGAHVLDLGCGLGGPARRLVTDFDCRVVGVDITREFLDIALGVTACMGLSDRIEFRHGDAVDVKLPGAGFDFVWMQVAAANIPDRDKLYRNIYSALKPGGKFALYDNFKGSSPGIHFPVPWARDESTSTLLTEAETIAKCEAVGFECIVQRPESKASIWVRAQYDLNVAWNGDGPPPLGQNILLSNFAEICASQLKNLKDDKVRFGYQVFEKL